MSNNCFQDSDEDDDGNDKQIIPNGEYTKEADDIDYNTDIQYFFYNKYDEEVNQSNTLSKNCTNKEKNKKLDTIPEEANSASDDKEEDSFSEKDSTPQEEIDNKIDNKSDYMKEESTSKKKYNSNFLKETGDYEYCLKGYGDTGNSNVLNDNNINNNNSKNIKDNNNFAEMLEDKADIIYKKSQINTTNTTQKDSCNKVRKLILPKNNPLMKFAKNNLLVNKNSNSVSNKPQSYEDQIIFIVKNINNEDNNVVQQEDKNKNVVQQLVDQFSNLMFTTDKYNKYTEYNNNFLNKILEYALSNNNVYLLYEIRYILSNKQVQNDLEISFKYKNIKNLDKVIELLQRVDQIRNKNISEEVRKIIGSTLFNFNSLSIMYSIIYPKKNPHQLTKQEKLAQQDAVNEFLRLLNNPLLLGIYFNIYEDMTLSEGFYLCKILNYAKNKCEVLYNQIRKNISYFVTMLCEIDTNNNEAFSYIKQNIVKVLLSYTDTKQK